MLEEQARRSLPEPYCGAIEDRAPESKEIKEQQGRERRERNRHQGSKGKTKLFF